VDVELNPRVLVVDRCTELMVDVANEAHDLTVGGSASTSARSLIPSGCAPVPGHKLAG
jgi:hypothetical protein